MEDNYIIVCSLLTVFFSILISMLIFMHTSPNLEKYIHRYKMNSPRYRGYRWKQKKRFMERHYKLKLIRFKDSSE